METTLSAEDLLKETSARVMRGCKIQCEGPKVVARLKEHVHSSMLQILLVSYCIIGGDMFVYEGMIWA